MCLVGEDAVHQVGARAEDAFYCRVQQVDVVLFEILVYKLAGDGNPQGVFLELQRGDVREPHCVC